MAVLFTSCAAQQNTANRAAVPPAPVTTGSASTTSIPAGTTVVIRALQPISAASAEEGNRYDAEVAQDIVNVNGDVLVPRGSRAQLTVLNASGGGAVGTSKLELGLASVTVNGRPHMVQTGTVAEHGRQGLGANRRTAETVGGGAALGAIIGAIAGGGSGAAAGAAIGAAGGAAAQVLTRGDKINVPSESVLTFRLEQPIYLR